MTIPKHTEHLLEDLAESLQVPTSRYEAAERSYKSVANWLHRASSSVLPADPEVYVQGSFRLGTAIRPVSDSEEYDVDLVGELARSKTSVTQAQLKNQFGHELHTYAQANGMTEPQDKRRCWTLEYADGAQFHLDILPALPDAARQRMHLQQRGHSTEWADTAIAITDRDDPNFARITEHWPHSNPRGYANWFQSRMRKIFDARRLALALESRVSVEDIPEYQVRTPPQSAVQILKHHRDMMFADRADDKPISIILTTLAAHAYQQEPTITRALYSILDGMDQHIDYTSGFAWIPNPTDPAENFADRWQHYPGLRAAFYEWLDTARRDFATAAGALDRESAAAALRPSLGQRLIDKAVASPRRTPTIRTFHGPRHLARELNPTHRRPPPWPPLNRGQVQIQQATMQRSGFRTRTLRSDGKPLPRRCSLRFQAFTDIPQPFTAYWQVVNTGFEARAAQDLRGGFEEGSVTNGILTKSESTLYAGTHSIECLVVKDGNLAAQSGQFIVNIE